jgi:NADPH:quinone reductase
VKAFRTHRLGTAPALEEAALPEPGAGEVRIAVKAAGLHLTDVAALAGERVPKPQLPFTPGFEAAGLVTALGKGVKGLKLGQPVLAFLAGGGLADEALANAALCAALPEALGFEQAASLPVAYGGALMALRDQARLKGGETLLVLGAGGQAGLAAIGIGKELGARVIAAAGVEERRSAASAQGADDTVDGSSASLADSVLSLTDGKGANVVFDPVGGDAFAAALHAASIGARYIAAGFAGGRARATNVQMLFARNIQLLTANIPVMAASDPARARHALEDVIAWAIEGKIKPRIAARFALAQAAHALDYVKARRDSGAVIVTLS